MKYTGSVLLIILGAVLALAVNVDLQGLDLNMIGIILAVGGGIWLLITVIYDVSASSRRNQARPTDPL